MERRSFLKFLVIAPLAPKVAVDVLSAVPVPTHAQHVIAHQALSTADIAKKFHEAYGPLVTDLFKRHNMCYEMFAEHRRLSGVGRGYHFDVKLSD